MINVTKLHKSYKSVKALDDVTLEIPSGKIFALLGPNGAGKTTLIKILCGLVLADRGNAAIHGIDVFRNPEEVRTLISLVIADERSFYWRLTGRENLKFFAALYELDRVTAHKRIQKSCEIFELEELDKCYQVYSSGMKQRLALARSYLNDAKILFLDEPSRSLDPGNASKLRKSIQNYVASRPDRTVFLTTHNTQEAEQIADLIAVLDQGKIKGFGTMETLREQIDDNTATLDEIFLKLCHSERSEESNARDPSSPLRRGSLASG